MRVVYRRNKCHDQMVMDSCIRRLKAISDITASNAHVVLDSALSLQRVLHFFVSLPSHYHIHPGVSVVLNNSYYM